MASAMTRSWKLQEFTAHKSNVNSLALGHKSGRVLVTGGDDKKVNLWAVGKERCIMSLSGHTTPVECVKFGQNEDFVGAGSQTGAIKIWDLEHAKLLRTLTGHKAGIRCMEFHPYGELLTSGSADTGIKLWDTKRKGCIFTYKGHDEAVNSVKFSPDGQWIASAGDEGTIKLWDLRTGRQLKEFTEHKRAATVIEFHPHEFLLASGSADRTVHFWDLESFQLVSSTEPSMSSIRCLKFGTDGQCLFTGCQDVLKVHCWEPARTLDTVSTSWGKIHDFAIAANQLIGASSSGSVVSVYVCDTTRIKPYGSVNQFMHGNSTRKSFSTKDSVKKASISVKTIEDDKSGTDPEDDVTIAEILNVTDYRDVFQPHRSLNRTPPPEPEAFPAPHDVDPTQPQIIQNLSTSMSSLSTTGTLDNDDDLSPTSSTSQPPSLSMTKPVPVRVNPIKSSPPLQRHTFTSTSQIKANLQANNAIKAAKNLAQVPPMKQSIIPAIGKKTNHPMGPQRSNSTLTSRVAPMAAVTPVMGDGKSKSRAPSPDSPKHFLKRQTSCRNGDVYDNDFPVQINTSIRHSPSDPALNRPNTGQSRTSTTNLINSGGISARNTIGIKKNNRAQIPPNPKVEIRQVRPIRPIEDSEKNDFIPMAPDKGVGLDPSDFLPNSYGGSTRIRCSQGVPEMSEAEAINSILGGHNCMMTVMANRNRALQVIDTLLHNKGVKAAIDSAVDMNDLSIVVDLLGVLNTNSTMWNLDMCNSLLPQIAELLKSKYEMYVTVGSTALKLILRNFAPMIKSNVEAPLHTIGVDVSREERYEKSLSCYKILETIQPLVQKKQGIIGPMGASFRELNVLMNSVL